jgi:hypothetical protein
MFWLLATAGVFLLLAALMFVPDWVRWARWSSRRKRFSKSKARRLRAPVAAPFWSNYSGPYVPGSDGGGGDCSPGSVGGAAGSVGGSDGGGGCD